MPPAVPAIRIAPHCSFLQVPVKDLDEKRSSKVSPPAKRPVCPYIKTSSHALEYQHRPVQQANTLGSSAPLSAGTSLLVFPDYLGTRASCHTGVIMCDPGVGDEYYGYGGGEAGAPYGYMEPERAGAPYGYLPDGSQFAPSESGLPGPQDQHWPPGFSAASYQDGHHQQQRLQPRAASEPMYRPVPPTVQPQVARAPMSYSAYQQLGTPRIATTRPSASQQQQGPPTPSASGKEIPRPAQSQAASEPPSASQAQVASSAFAESAAGHSAMCHAHHHHRQRAAHMHYQPAPQRGGSYGGHGGYW